MKVNIKERGSLGSTIIHIEDYIVTAEGMVDIYTEGFSVPEMLKNVTLKYYDNDGELVKSEASADPDILDLVKSSYDEYSLREVYEA